MSNNHEYFSQAAVARALNISRQAINKQVDDWKERGIANEFGKININHPFIREYAERLGIKQLNIQGPPPKEKPQKKVSEPKNDKPNERKGGIVPKIAPIEPSNIISGDITIDDIAHMTIREVAEKYGGIAGFKNYVDAQAKMMEWQDKESKFMERRSQLVSVSYFKTIFSLLDLAFKSILEAPERWADETIAKAKSEKAEARIDMIDLHKTTLSRILKSVKEEVLKMLDAEKN